MSPLYLYGLLAEPPPGPMPVGLAGEPLRLVSCEGVLAAVGEVREGPALDAAALGAHDAAVRRLAAASSALLPARFGSLASSEGQLCEALRPRATALRAALEAVRGCEQMTLRFAWPATADGPADPSTSPSAPAGLDEGGPGTRYLSARRAVAGDPRSIPEVQRVLQALAPFVRGERRERHERPPLVASVYHLVRREALPGYRAALDSLARDGSIRVTSSGPWPAYAFAADDIA